MISAAITPGIHPHKVKINVIKKDPQPLSTTANEGKMMARRTLKRLMIKFYFSTLTIKCIETSRTNDKPREKIDESTIMSLPST